jgi:chitin synthase
MNKYTTKPTEALHYVQYDQGEDRWLCTLLLQKGWRIEYCAASDSYTHAPEGFGEFYTQRRRWAPSTMANIMDLLGDYKRTVECNTDISKPYIIYQGMLMIGTILSPGTIFLMVVGAMNTVMGLTSDVALICNIVPVLLFSIVCLTVKDNNHIIFVATILSTLYALLMLAVLVGTGIEISEKGVLTPNSIFFISLIASFIVAAIIHPQEFACVIPLFLYMLLIPSMYLLLTIYSVTNMHIVSWGTREVKSKLTAKEQAMEAQKAAEEAAAKSKKKSKLAFLDFSQFGGKSGLFTCMCCSNTKSEEESAKLSDIREQLNKVSENVSTLKTNLEPRTRTSVYRRQSSLKDKRFIERTDSLSTIMGGQTDEEDEELSDSERRSTTDERPRTPSLADSVSANKPKWVRDKTFKKYPIVPLTPKELQFWQEFIPKYLLPLDENLKEQERIANDLKELRNKAVFAFGIINTIFILFVFLLQMHKDVFGVNIPAGTDGYNRTYIEAEDRYELTPNTRYVRMDPIGLVLVVFFGAILIVQCIGMFMHRFGTLAHLLAFTTIDFCTNQNEPEDDDTLLNKNAVKILKQIQKVKDMDEENSNLPMNRKQSLFPKPPQELDLDEVFRKRMLSITPENLGNMGQSLYLFIVLKKKCEINRYELNISSIMNTLHMKLSFKTSMKK